MTVLKNSNIMVRVEEALADLLVVSYRPHDAAALYQGVLLHSNKVNLPYGVNSLHPAFLVQGKSDVNEDRLHSVSQRFTYQEQRYVPTATSVLTGKGKTRTRQKMTVRLRPRKVLCSNCKGICNENSENVDIGPRRPVMVHTASPSAFDEKNFLRGHSLIPRLSRLQPSEISAATAPRTVVVAPAPVAPVPPADALPAESRADGEGDRPVTAFGAVFSSARTLKICFGEGEGTVLKIPAIVADLNEDSGVSSDVGRAAGESREAKRALKRARRLARRHRVKRKKRHQNEERELEEEEGEEAPAFPAGAECTEAERDVGSEAVAPAAGDVVWGKLAGFPWWPARVLAVQATRAHVAWYACTTTSYVHFSHLVPFLPYYDIRFNKKKRGAYKEAVRLATTEAQAGAAGEGEEGGAGANTPTPLRSPAALRAHRLL